ncbi:MAG: alanine--tRNA ligase [Candidatus Nanoarchaeia archaeon]
MRTAKELKKELKKSASKDPDSYYATNILKGDGFERKQCVNCGQWFWTVNIEQKKCGDPVCSGGFRFFEDNPAKIKLDYINVWKKFSEMFKDLGYTPITRYPTVARWNDTMEYTNASIAAFQPYVISGEVEPPAKWLVIPQFCIRFDDIENIGITAGHNTGFIMIGQHMFVPKEEWSQEKVFSDIKKFLNEGLGLPDEELTFHEDGWAGGGNAGPCMEYFCRGVELGNQVYMLYEQTPHDKLVELDLKVLDMGMGMERVAWFTQATATQHQAIYPTVIEKLSKRTGVKIDEELLKKYVPHSGKLNIDEVEDLQKAWKEVSELVGMEVNKLKEKIMPMSGIFSIADHTRVLLFALNDGALPSNVGGGYNLRILVRRCLSFIDKFNWDIELSEVCRWHAEYLKPMFPELLENLENIEKILEVEKEKFNATKEKTEKIVQKIIHKEITEDTLLELYDSNGITPDLIKREAEKHGKTIEIPDNFFGKVSELHEKKEQTHASKKDFSLDLTDLPDTKAKYFDDYSKCEFKAKVLRIIENKVILDETFFYPTSGGQLHDTGTIGDQEVEDVFKQGGIIVHVLKEPPKFSEGDNVTGKVDFVGRKQLAQHHTATHIVNLAARKVLGNHINQAGAKKTCKKAHLDITHYKPVTDDELKRIEDEANKVIEQELNVKTGFYPRREAEDKFGMSIYQGGAVPGQSVRIVEIEGLDAEACGGTHLKSTGEVGKIKLEKSTKIQDGIVRLTYTAGYAADTSCAAEENVLKEAAKLLGVKENQVPARAQELFTKWKKAKKAKKKGESLGEEELKLTSTEEFEGDDALAETAQRLKTQPEHVTKTINRFLNELEEIKE